MHKGDCSQVDIIFIISGFGVGLLVGLTGVGGGALMTPLPFFIGIRLVT